MKHYTESKWNELDAIDLWGRNRSRAENIRAAKASYRRRERRVLDRMVEEMTIEELGDDFAYWDAELDKAAAEWHRLLDERRIERENCEWYGAEEPDEGWYDQRIGEVEKQVAVAYREWIEAA